MPKTCRRAVRWLAALLAICTAGLLAACATFTPAHEPFRNAYTAVPEDRGLRVPPTYFLRRAWVQITRDLSATDVPPSVPLDVAALAQRPFAVSWLGHSAMLMRAGNLWVLFDPVLSNTAGPVPGIGPARLTPLPIAPDALPHIDLVLTSHDHYDHLDAATIRRLARQPGGPPQFWAGRGLAPWFADVAGVPAREFNWWQSATVGDLTITFTPAQHNSGRGVWNRNATLWGGWMVERGGRRFYFPGDTAYVQALFADVRARLGAPDLAALPIGAYQPRERMRFEHTDPDDAVLAHVDLGATRSFGVHWATFQLGDEEPFQPARDLAGAVARRGVPGFGLLPVGGVVDVATGGLVGHWVTPAQLAPVRANALPAAAPLQK